MLIRNNIGATAHLVARHSNAVVKFIILGSAEIFVKSADLSNNLSAVSRSGVFLFAQAVGLYEATELPNRILSQRAR